ncbi:MAG: hypothetical protein ACE5E9_02505 [Nitrospinaceae bacterium]
MVDFTYIKYGVLLAMIAILFGGSLGLSFGCCEDDIKGILKDKAHSVLSDKYQGKSSKARKVVNKSWSYLKRAHFHSQTMGVIAIAFSLLIAWLKIPPRLQMGISILAGFGSLGYGAFWFFSALLAPGMGSTGAAKEAVGLVAQVSAGSFFAAGVTVFSTLIYKMFIQRRQETGTGSGA